jgi:hypothetical protein
MFYTVIGAIRLADKSLVDSGLKQGLAPSRTALRAHAGKDVCLAIILTFRSLSLCNIFCKLKLK